MTDKLTERQAQRKVELSTPQSIGALVRFAGWPFMGISVMRLLSLCILSQATALVIQAFFDTLSGTATQVGAWLSPWGLCAVLVGLALVRAVTIVSDAALSNTFVFRISTLLRANILKCILGRPGAWAVPGSPGEALSRLADADQLSDSLCQIPFLLGYGAFAVIAVVKMVQINARITLIVFLPLVVLVFAAGAVMQGIEKYRRAFRQADGNVTDFLGELFGAVQAVQVAAAERPVIERFRTLNSIRGQAAIKDSLFNQLLESVFWNAMNFGTGLLLLVAGGVMQASSFTVGDFALFAFYTGFVTQFVGALGMGIALYIQAGVSIKRMLALLQGASPKMLIKHEPIYLRELPPVPFVPKSDAHHLEKLEAFGLTYKYPDSGRGIENVHLSLTRGSFTVITGRVGSGKTTLLRVLLGLLPWNAGEVRWNNEQVNDPASFFVFPRSAYTAQVPLLFSMSLCNNILLGLPEDRVDLEAAIRQAVLERDVADMVHGLDTLVGASGVRLSGGQRQRVAAARMFVRNPELLVFDDLSSALDVETEQLLWDRLFTQGNNRATCLVVSHRRPALRRADRIIVLKDGKLEAEGKLDDLLENCQEMQRLWQGDIGASDDLRVNNIQ